MGVKLPLMNPSEIPNVMYGQNPYTSHVVKIPIKNAKGALAFTWALIARNQDVSVGYLPYSKENIIKQGFKFLGERYGWGHDYNGRDCTGFVGEIYKSFGLIMPRNSGQQGQGRYGINQTFILSENLNESVENKVKKILSTIEVGDLLYISGHVMMYLGDDNAEPYIIHDVKGLSYFDHDNKFYRGTLNGVSVTPLLPLQLSEEANYIDRIYNVKKIMLKEHEH
jgi:cell wall-associated NlpC family hydrolase